MELDSFLAQPRWDILRIIIDEPSSPLKISEELGTTISFVSQQLKLLEAKGLVKKERTGEVEKGKPRSVYSISEESAYIVPLTKELDKKKLIPLTKENKIILKIWTIDDKEKRLTLEKFFWRIQESLDNIDFLAVELEKRKYRLYILTKEEKASHQLNNLKEPKGLDLKVIDSISPLFKLEKESFLVLYDPEAIFLNNLKGGQKKDE